MQGNCASIVLSLIICIVVSLLKPQNYDWTEMRNIPIVSTETAYEIPEKGEESLEALNKVLKTTYATGTVLALLLVSEEEATKVYLM